jgi:arylsulfatase A-like enzyme
MKRPQRFALRPPLRSSWRLALAATVLLGLSCHGRKGETPPNVVLISIDTLRADRLSLYGHSRPTSPRIGALARQGVVFTQAFSQSPVTAPSHMSILTGHYQETHQTEQIYEAEGLLPDRRGPRRLDDGIPTIATLLRRYGYSTAAVTGGVNLHPRLGFDQGFDQYSVISDLIEARQDAVKKVMAMVRAQPERPFFLFFHTYEVHSPYVRRPFYRTRFASPDYRGDIPKTDRELQARSEGDPYAAFWGAVKRNDPADRAWIEAVYDESIRAVDDQLGLFFESLEQMGVFGNTLLVVLSDHGEEFGEHGKFNHEQIYQELLHVPLIFRFPPAQRPDRPGLRVDNVVRLIDVLPTVLDALSLPVPEALPGQSLLRLVQRGEVPEVKVLSSKRETGRQALRLRNWKLILSSTSAPELYNLRADPQEKRDLAEQQPGRLAKLMHELDELLQTSRRLRPEAGETTPFELDAETTKRLRALGYL